MLSVGLSLRTPAEIVPVGLRGQGKPKEGPRRLAVSGLEGRQIPWVFHRDGQPIKSFRRAWVSACKRSLLVGMIPHDLRRTAVRNLERAGVSRSVAMKLTGHRTEAVYRRYATVAESDMREGAAKLAALHGNTASEHTRGPAATDEQAHIWPTLGPDDITISSGRDSAPSSPSHEVGGEGIVVVADEES